MRLASASSDIVVEKLHRSHRVHVQTLHADLGQTTSMRYELFHDQKMKDMQISEAGLEMGASQISWQLVSRLVVTDPAISWPPLPRAGSRPSQTVP